MKIIKSLLAILIICITTNGYAGESAFRIVQEKAGNATQLIAENDGSAPVSINVALTEASNITSSTAWPIRMTIGAHARIVISTVFPTNPRLASSLRYQTSWKNAPVGLTEKITSRISKNAAGVIGIILVLFFALTAKMIRTKPAPKSSKKHDWKDCYYDPKLFRSGNKRER